MKSLMLEISILLAAVLPAVGQEKPRPQDFVAAGGENVGYLWTGGRGFTIGIRRGLSAMPILRIIKSSLTDFQASYGLVLGWGR